MEKTPEQIKQTIDFYLTLWDKEEIFRLYQELENRDIPENVKQSIKLCYNHLKKQGKF